MTGLLAARRARHREAVVAYLRGTGWTYGYDMWRHLRVGGGLYPVLVGLEQDGVVESRWQEPDEHPAGQPRRRLYRLREGGTA